jgi:hypothetical protein
MSKFEKVERTPEEQAAIDERLAQLKEERVAYEQRKRNRARNRVIDIEATAKKLVKEKKVTATWVNRQIKNNTLAKMVKTACIAYEFDAINLGGNPLPWMNLIQRS